MSEQPGSGQNHGLVPQVRAQPTQPYYPPQQQVLPAPYYQPPPPPGYYYPPQPGMMVYGYAPSVQNNVVVVNNQRGPDFFARAIWFIFVGWWLSGIWLFLSYSLCMTFIALPIGLYMLNRIPQVMTLKPKGSRTSVSMSSDGFCHAPGL